MNLIGFIITLVILGLIFWLVFWLVDYLGLPEPFNKVIKVIVALVMVLYLIGALGGLTTLPAWRI